jgi:hypothetical protein
MWIFDWLLEMIPGGLPEGSFSAKVYPKTFAWRERYREACDAAKSKLGHRPVIEGHEAAKRIIGSQFHEQNLREVGELLGLTHQEAVVEKKTQNGEARVRVHLPRWNYRVEPADARNGVANHHHSVHQHGGDEGLGAEHYEERH